jgi:O-antigen/teichoic acid export membrane protein
MAALGLATWLARRELATISLGQVRPAELRRMARALLPFGLRSLIGLTYQRGDAVLLSLLGGFEAVGLYRAAYKVLELATLGPEILHRALFPGLAAMHRGPRQRLRTFFERQSAYLAAVGLLLSLFIAWLSGPLMQLLFGIEYQQATSVLVVLSAVILLKYCNASIVGIVTTSDFQARLTGLAVVVAATSLGLNFLLIPELGALGAAIAAIGTELVATLIYATLVRACLGSTAYTRNLGAVLLAGLPAAGMAYLLSLVSPLLIPLALPIYVVLLARLGLPTPSERRVVIDAAVLFCARLYGSFRPARWTGRA